MRLEDMQLECRRLSKRAALVAPVVLFATLTATAHAQTPPSAPPAPAPPPASQSAPPAPASSGRPPCTITGAIVSSGQPLPGVAVTAAIEGREVARAATGLDGRYTLHVPTATNVSAVPYALAA